MIGNLNVYEAKIRFEIIFHFKIRFESSSTMKFIVEQIRVGGRCHQSTVTITSIVSNWTHLFHQPFLILCVCLLLCPRLNILIDAQQQQQQQIPSPSSSLPSSVTKNNESISEADQFKDTNSLTTKTTLSTVPLVYETTPSLDENANHISDTKIFTNSEKSLNPLKTVPSTAASTTTVTAFRYELHLNATPSNPVVNCTDMEFRCELFNLDQLENNNWNNVENIDQTLQQSRLPTIWWTFRGSNVSAITLPGGRVTNEKSNLSILNIDCAQFGIHNGDYMCHISDNDDPLSSLSFSSSSSSSIISSGKSALEIYVPLSLESSSPSNGTIRELVDAQVQLKCHIYAYPKPRIIWQRIDLNTLILSDIEEDGRIVVETKSYPESMKTHSMQLPSQLQNYPHIPVVTIESELIFKSLMRVDNGSYACKAQSSYTFEKPLSTTFNVIVLEMPQIHIEKLEIENKTVSIVTFVVDYDGNLSIEKYQLEIMNYTMNNSSWIAQDVNVASILNNKNYSTINVENLTPGANYGFRLAAKNNVGQSDWSYMNISVPPDVPSTISNVHLLSKTNETLLFGWRRPFHDNGGIISRYQMILKDSSLDVIISNQTLDITITGTSSRNNYMYMFPNLKPGSHYNFQVRACSDIGCSEWSAVLDAVTSDGHSDPPLNIRFECHFEMRSLQNNATITWEPPTNPRGSIIGYNISLEGFAQFKNSNNRLVLDQFRQFYETMNIDTFRFEIGLKPNTNYTVRMCAINKSGCGQMSHITSMTMCQTAQTIPSEFPPNIRLERFKSTIVRNNNGIQIAPFTPSRQLKLFVPRISERNGSIKCYRIIMIRLPNIDRPNGMIPIAANNDSFNDVPGLQYYEKFLSNGPDSITLSTYKNVKENKKELLGAYIDKEFSSDNFRNDIIIGDGKVERCYEDAPDYDVRSRIKTSAYSAEDNRSPRRINYDLTTKLADDELHGNFTRNLVEDGELVANTNYSAIVEVTILTWNKTLLIARSPFIEPVETEPLQLIIPDFNKSSFSETANGILFGTIFGLLLVIILLFSVLCFIKRKATETSQSMLEDERIGLTSIIRRTIGRKRKHSLFHPLNFNSPNSVKKWASSPIPIHNIVAQYQERHANTDFLFQAEFESLPDHFPDRTTIHCDAPENVNKNRYPDIKSYDQTRVTLSKTEDGESDYINADFVSGYKNQKQFICAQGPMQKTIGDFWRMIYEQKCFIIVMLTGIEEQGRIKCAQYWNDEKPKEVTNKLKVTVKSLQEYSDYSIRRIQLDNSKTNEKREILHFHFTSWRDFLAPEQPSWLLRFIKRVNEHHCMDRGPILVHCSAGVGRTGSFIAMDTLISEVDDGAEQINVFDCVSNLRHQRNFLVQSLKQYIFVYRAIMEYIEFGDTEIEVSHLNDYYKQLKEQTFECGNGLIMEYEKLGSVNEVEDPKACIVGMMDMNRAKNRYDFIIPYDINRVILSPSSSKDQSYYINASFIQGYDHSLAFVVAQDPMENTMNEFWWMIVEQNVTTLVMLAELGEGQSKCHCYWPSDEFDCDHIKIKLIEEEMTQYFTKRVFNVTQKKSTDVHTVTQYQFLAWKSGVVPESTISLFTLVDIVLANNKSSSSPVLVHCSGGGDRSSVFVAFASLIKQLEIENRVDIFQTVRYIRSQRQCMIKTIAQYDFLYRCIIDYVDYHNIGNRDTQL